MYVIGFAVLDFLLGVRRAPYAIVVIDSPEFNMRIIRGNFAIGSDMGLHVVDTVDPLISPDLDTVLNIDEYRLLDCGQVVDKEGQGVSSIGKVVLRSEVDAIFKAVKILRTDKLYPEIRIPNSIVESANDYLQDIPREKRAELLLARYYWDQLGS